MHINNPILYSQTASTDKTCVNIAEHNNINIQQTQGISEVILRDKYSGSSFYRKQMPNTDEFSNTSVSYKPCVSDIPTFGSKNYRGNLYDIISIFYQ